MQMLACFILGPVIESEDPNCIRGRVSPAKQLLPHLVLPLKPRA